MATLISFQANNNNPKRAESKHESVSFDKTSYSGLLKAVDLYGEVLEESREEIIYRALREFLSIFAFANLQVMAERGRIDKKLLERFEAYARNRKRRKLDRSPFEQCRVVAERVSETELRISVDPTQSAFLDLLEDKEGEYRDKNITVSRATEAMLVHFVNATSAEFEKNPDDPKFRIPTEAEEDDARQKSALAMYPCKTKIQ
jgi:hypothetical protein